MDDTTDWQVNHSSHKGRLISGESVVLEIDNDVISAITPSPDASSDSLPWILPPLFDPQINGFAGVDLQQDDVSLDDLLKLARGLRANGCSQFLATLITAPWPVMLKRLKHLKQLRSQSAELASSIAGWHIEGPFISSEPGYVGAHDPASVIDPSPHLIAVIKEITHDDPVLLTLAPERNNAIQTIVAAVEAGIVVSLGHTNANREQLDKAIAAGASAFTHLGNGCPKQLDRHENILVRVLDSDGLAMSLIPDTFHVPPALFRLFHKLIPKDKLFYTTDAMAAAGAPPGDYRLGSLTLTVGEDGVVRLPGQNQLAGSALTPIAGVLRAASMLNEPIQKVWPYFSDNARRLMRLPPALDPGVPAHFCMAAAEANGEWKIDVHDPNPS